MKKRSLFNTIFGKKESVMPTQPRFELLQNATNYYSAWNGDVFNNDIVRACIRPKANAVGKFLAKHIQGSDENTRINPDARIRDVLQRPNPYMSMQDMLCKLVYQREIYHNAFAYIKRDNKGYPMEIYPIPYSSVELYGMNDVYVKFTFWNGKIMTVPYTELIHLRKDFNNNDFFGESGYKALCNLMEIINTTDQSVVNAVKNSAVIKWIMKFKSVLQPKDVELQIKDFTTNYLNISNTGGAAASDPRYDLEQVKDNTYVPNAEQMEKTKQRLYSYFGVNDKIVQNNYNENEWNAFYEAEIEPIAIQLSNAFTYTFFSKRELGFNNKIIFEAVNLTYSSMQSKLGLVNLVDRGIMNPNEVRKIMNLPPIESGNDYIRRLDTAVIEDTKEEVKEEEDDN